MADGLASNYGAENPPVQFQQPPSVNQPQLFAQSLDAMFNNVIKARLANSQIQAQQQQISQAQQEQALQRGGAYLQNAAFGGPDPMALGQQLLQNPQAAQSPQFNLDNHINNYANMMRAQYELGYRKTETETAKVGAEASKASAEAKRQEIVNKLIDPEGDSQNPDPSKAQGLIGNMLRKVEKKELTPEEGNDWMSRNPDVHLAYLNGISKSNVNVADLQRQADAQAAGMKSSAQLTQGGTSQQMARTSQSAFNQFDKLQTISDEVGRYDNRLLNKPFLQIAATEAPGAAKLKAAFSAARIEYARASSGSQSPSDVFMSEAKNALPDETTGKQLPEVIKTLKDSLSGIAQGQMTPATLESVNKQSKAKKSPKTNKWSGGATHTYPDGTQAQWNGTSWVKK